MGLIKCCFQIAKGISRTSPGYGQAFRKAAELFAQYTSITTIHYCTPSCVLQVLTAIADMPQHVVLNTILARVNLEQLKLTFAKHANIS